MVPPPSPPPYRDTRLFKDAGNNTGRLPHMLWEILQRLGYKKPPEYCGTQVTYEGSEPVWKVQVHNFAPRPLRGTFEVGRIHEAIAPRKTFSAEIRDAACQACMVIRSRYRQYFEDIEYAYFPQRASGSTYIHAEPVPGQGHAKFKKQVTLTTVISRELDSTTEELGFWQEKYEEAMKTVRQLK
ncbi:hypothetical protein QOZ80_UnG0720310 [Eleusine coracana subsp. coracana]|uniref:Uncharacterized protein n=1 Tax=Eleusine coracana subsp. coracana TaxID=191504 RepID=A0AAV9G2D9_ELECO|nr:hypothetical protein QOZ80_UnG0720310 [Eleusine coracana subsp. coracana]